MSFKRIIIFFVLFMFLFFLFSDGILFNEEFLICFSLIFIFYIIYQVIYKSVVLFFILDIEYLYLILTYLLKLNISLINKIEKFLNIYLNLLVNSNNIISLDLKYLYLKLLSKKLLKFENCILFIDNTLNIRKDFWLIEGLYIYIKKNIFPNKYYNFLKLNNISISKIFVKNFYENYYFIFQYIYI